ncbi:helix-turn-helix domain-containing protein [Ligilactobacillus salivarius]|uniref:helix-turn-helix domain-containing protein n=1 Tax=Ligilactobacillus salivarius TaxID=1624 RepID=UPI000685494B|nr:helix-turn-helix domain-containing protein [Ligilactobacillus salivarius]MBX0283855.1 helix-turn-helix domain-containing protein [Ligilactobacillus salivarius]TXJ82889.1 helix-turn-helix domain-containing protein [Ligilactobacillus salivarius]
MNVFQKRLKEAIENMGITQAELARRSGISRASITDYLKGKYEAKQDKIYPLARALNVSEAWLMGYSDDASNSVDKAFTFTLTFNLPADIIDELHRLSGELGVSTSALIKVSIFKYLDVPRLDNLSIIPKNQTDNKNITLVVNNWIYSILKRQSTKYGLSIDELMYYASVNAVKYYTSVLKDLK